MLAGSMKALKSKFPELMLSEASNDEKITAEKDR